MRIHSILQFYLSRTWVHDVFQFYLKEIRTGEFTIVIKRTDLVSLISFGDVLILFLHALLFELVRGHNQQSALIAIPSWDGIHSYILVDLGVAI